MYTVTIKNKAPGGGNTIYYVGPLQFEHEEHNRLMRDIASFNSGGTNTGGPYTHIDEEGNPHLLLIMFPPIDSYTTTSPD